MDLVKSGGVTRVGESAGGSVVPSVYGNDDVGYVIRDADDEAADGKVWGWVYGSSCGSLGKVSSGGFVGSVVAVSSARPAGDALVVVASVVTDE